MQDRELLGLANTAMDRATNRRLDEIGSLQCPVCGFYCVDNGGIGCIGKKSMYEAAAALAKGTSEG